MSDDPEAMRDRATELYEQCAVLGEQADLLMARSELSGFVLYCRNDLEYAELQLAEARKDLAAATAAYEPVAAQLDRVQEQLAALADRTADETLIDTVSLDDRLAASARRLALEYELTRLEPVAGKRDGAVRNARELIGSYERDSLPTFRKALADAERMEAAPPLDDFSKLVVAAPRAAQSRALRMGLVLLYMVAGTSSPHAIHVRAAVYRQLLLSGEAGALEDEWLRRLLGRVDPRTRAAIEAAISPPDLRQEPLPGRGPVPASPADVVNDLRGQWAAAREAGGASVAEAAARRAVRGGQR